MASIPMSSATGSTYTCGHDATAAGGSAADRRRRRADPHSRQHAQRDVAGGAAVLRQPAQRFWRITGDIFGFDAASDLRRTRRRAARVWRRGLGCASAVPTGGQPRFGDRTGQHGGQRLRASSSTRTPRSIASSSTVRRRRRTSSASPAIDRPLRYRRLPSTSPAQTMRYADKLAMPGGRHWPVSTLGGLRCAHGRTFSICAANDNSVASSNGLPDDLDRRRQAVLVERPTARPRQADPFR